MLAPSREKYGLRTQPLGTALAGFGSKMRTAADSDAPRGAPTATAGAFVRQDRLPRRFEELRIAFGDGCAEWLMENKLPGMQLEQVRDPAILEVDEAALGGQADVFDVDVPGFDAGLFRDQAQVSVVPLSSTESFIDAK